MVFEVWDVHSRNLIGTYETVDGALTQLRLSYEEHPESLDGFLLGIEAEDGASMTIAEGEALKQLVVHHCPERAEAV